MNPLPNPWRPANAPMPYTVDDWPNAAGFWYDHKTKSWTKGDYRLFRLSSKCYKLYRGINDEGVLVESLCRVPASIVMDLIGKFAN